MKLGMLRRPALAIYAVVLVYLQVTPQRTVPASSDEVLELVIHVGMYFGLGLLVAWNARFNEWVVLAVAASAGSVLEAVQVFIPGRLPDVHDLVGNLVGAVLAMGVTSAWVELRKPAPHEVQA